MTCCPEWTCYSFRRRAFISLKFLFFIGFTSAMRTTVRCLLDVLGTSINVQVLLCLKQFVVFKMKFSYKTTRNNKIVRIVYHCWNSNDAVMNESLLRAYVAADADDAWIAWWKGNTGNLSRDGICGKWLLLCFCLHQGRPLH